MKEEQAEEEWVDLAEQAHFKFEFEKLPSREQRSPIFRDFVWIKKKANHCELFQKKVIRMVR